MLLALALRLEEPAVHARPRRRAARPRPERHPLPGRRRRAPAARSRGRLLLRTTRATSIRRCCSTALHPRMHILYKHEIDQIPDPGARVPAGRLHPDRPAEQGIGDALDRGGRAVDPRRQLVPDLSRKARAARPTSCCRSRRAASSWRSRRRRPIVPVAIQGGRAAMRKGSWIIRPVRVTIRVGRRSRPLAPPCRTATSSSDRVDTRSKS